MKKLTKIDGAKWGILCAAALVAGVVLLVVPRLALTDSATDIGVAQPPVITVIFDSSSSMQWAEGGMHHYPSLPDTADLPDSSRHLETWEPGTRLNFNATRRMHEGELRPLWDEDDAIFNNESQAGDNPLTVGPCHVWHPLHEERNSSWDHDHCDDPYNRPPRRLCSDDDYYDCEDEYPFGDDYIEVDEDDFEDNMWDYPDLRLSDDSETPRHIQLKQILGGDMYLGDQGTGPGCWFIPRFRGAMDEDQICCAELDENGRCANDDDPDPGDLEEYSFDRFIDHDDPVPHYQEVYDRQMDNGLLDSMGSTAIFSAAMFDGYRDDGTQSGYWHFPMHDIMAGDSPYAGGVSGDGLDWYDGDCASEDDSDCYNMGIFRFIGPTNYELDEEQMIRTSQYTKEAILDAGFLEHHFDDEDDERMLVGSGWVSMDDYEDGDYDDDLPVFHYPGGKQPMSQASPFGPVFHDLHQFHLNGQYASLEDYESSGGESFHPSAEYDPDDPDAGGDPYLGCRGRHTVMFTDGIAEPEAPGGAGNELGADVLVGGAFGFDPDKFPYLTAEDAIAEMVLAMDDQMDSALEGIDNDLELDDRHLARVHVVGAGVQDPEEDGIGSEEAQFRRNVLEKLGAMAAAGRTCAQAYLPPERIPEGEETGGDETGDCDLEDDSTWCLIPQDYSGYSFDSPGGERDMDNCEHPALALSTNDRDAIRDAFQLIFNEIAGLSGLSARTTPAMTSNLDWDDRMGQYRIFSGLEVSGDNEHWKGLLNRQLLECDGGDLIDPTDPDAADTLRFLHDDFARMLVDDTETGNEGEIEDVRDDGADQDRRRVFTSIPEFLPRYLEDDAENPVTSSDMEFSGGTQVNDFFEWGYRLQSAAGDADPFGDYDIGIGGSDADDAELFSRVPFDSEILVDTFGEAVGETGTDAEEAAHDYFRITEPPEPGRDRADAFEEMVDIYRGRTSSRADRILGAIYNSDPVAVGPPNLDLPIDSYREFRREYSERPTVLYTSTIDGQLRAIYTGEDDVAVKDNFDPGSDSFTDGPAEDQREAWAYIPQLVHPYLASFRGGSAPDGLMDGTPVVEDVRLCQRGSPYSSNDRVCPSGGLGNAEWRTVLVQGLGLAGPGYFALDVTRTGASLNGDDPELPDPVVMWEFGPEAEVQQLQRLDSEYYAGSETAEDSVYEQCEDFLDNDEPEYDDDDIEEPWELSFLGATVAEAAIGTVNVRFSSDTDDPGVQRPIALVGAGTSAGVDARDPFAHRSLSDSCTEFATGNAIYAIDLQSGQILRRFVTYDGGSNRFESEITGTPVLSGSTPADLSTRGFIGDDSGRMFRIDFTEPDPKDWDVDLFFDPDDELGDEDWGPAAFQPAVTVDSNRDLVLMYGLGQRGDAGAMATDQAVIAVKETFDPNEGIVEEFMWAEEFDDTERLTGKPVLFNNDLYFTTYVEPPVRCAAGNSRIWRIDYQTGEGSWDEELLEDSLDDIIVDPAERFFELEEPTLIRGMAITMGPMCELSGDDALGQSGQQQPQLVAQTAGVDAEESDTPGEAGAHDVGGISQLAVDLEAPDTQSIPLSWSVIEN